MSELATALQQSSLAGIGLTIAAYAVANSAWRRSAGSALLHPVVLATGFVATVLLILGIRYDTYLTHNSMLNEALSLVIVALAIPLYRQFALIQKSGSALVVTLIVGSFVAIFTALVLPISSGGSNEVIATLAPKSTTAAVAVEIAQRFGGIASLTAVLVISTGIFGAVFATSIFKATGVEDERAKGFALGVASHAIGTARAFQISDVAGAFASLGMILNALLTIALLPLVFKFII